MSEPSTRDVSALAMPCPKCAYDLRGHATSTKCPECGTLVEVGSAIAQAVHWFDLRLLDLWSIGVLQGSGCAAAILTLLAVRRGNHVALILGMTALVTLCVATLWFAALSPGILLRLWRPFFQVVGIRQRRRLLWWWITDAMLVALAPLAYWMLT